MKHFDEKSGCFLYYKFIGSSGSTFYNIAVVLWTKI